MAARFPEVWTRNGWQSRLDGLLGLLSDYDILLLEAPVGFGKARTIERWHHLLSGSGRAVYLLDCKIVDTEAGSAENFTTVAPYRIRWQRDRGAAHDILTDFARAGHAGRVLIIENLHDLPSQDLDFVRARLCNLPPMANAVLTCHSIPADWTVPLIAGGQVRIIGADQLSLDFDEFAERIQLLCGERFPPHFLRRIYGIIGGWPAAIEHAAIHILASPNRMETAEAFPELWPEQAHWMQEKIWHNLTRPDQEFLRRLAILGDAPLDMPSVCNTTGSIQAAAIIGELSKRTPFFQYDGRGLPFLRKVAARFLQQMTGEDDRQAAGRDDAPRLSSGINRRSIGHMRGSDKETEASWPRDDDLLNLVAAGQGALALQWLDDISGGELQNASTLFAIGLLGNDHALRTSLQKHGELASESPDHILLRALLAMIDDDVDQLDSCLGLLGEESGLSGPLAAAEKTLRLRCMRQLGQAQPFTSMALASDDTRRDNENFGFYCATALVDGAILLDMGQADAAVRLLTRVRNMALERLGEEALPTIELSAILGGAHLQAQQPEEARVLMKNWALPDLQSIDQWALQIGYLTLARLALRDGRPSDALSLLETIDRFAEDRGLLVAQARAGTAIANIAIQAGQPAVARHMATKLRKILAQAETCGPKRRGLVQLYASSGLAQIAIWTRDWSMALAQLKDAKPLAQHFGRVLELARMDELEQCCSSAGDDESRHPAALVGDADRATIISEIKILRQRPPKKADMDTATLALTQKEREVLELMARGFAKPLIAQALAISPETVKWHQKNIYCKFDIHDRQNVLSKARQLGMV